jgi:hypothetical protein
MTTTTYAGPSQGHGTIGYVHLERLAAKVPADDIEAEFDRLVDRLGDERARVLLMRRCSR